MRRFMSAFVITVFITSGSAAFAQDSGAKEEAKKAGAATKQAGKSTASAAKHIGKATVKGTRKVAGATKDKVQDTYICVDGTTDDAALKANACKDHGGVRVKAEKQ